MSENIEADTTDSATLADALPAEIKRVQAKKERWIEYAAEIDKAQPGSGKSLQFGINVMQFEIDVAIATLASGDVVAMLKAYETLKAYDDND